MCNFNRKVYPYVPYELAKPYSSNDENKRKFLINFFIELASLMYDEKKYMISKEELDTLIDDAIKKADLEKEMVLSESLIEGFKQEIYAGYFIEVDINAERDQFKFVHKSFFEYFVSQKIIDLIQKNNFNHVLLNTGWSEEIITFIEDSISDKKNENDTYPKLINIRNSIFDKIFFIPLTKILSSRGLRVFLIVALSLFLSYLIFLKNTETEVSNTLPLYKLISSAFIALGIFYLAGGVFNYFKKRLDFIAKSYYVDFKKNIHILSSNQLQYFIYSYRSFRFFKNIELENYCFKEIKLFNVFFLNSSFKNVEFKTTTFDDTNFFGCNLEDINFDSSEIKNLKFVKCQINKLNLEQVKFEKRIGKTGIKILATMIFLLDKHYIKKNNINFLRSVVDLIQNRIIFKDMELKDFDGFSLNQIQKFIINNNIKKKEIICDRELKKVFFQEV